jgi:hypothetical protein
LQRKQTKHVLQPQNETESQHLFGTKLLCHVV